MRKVEPAARYRVTIDSSVTTKDELFSRITDTVFLGYSSFNAWDQFIDMFLDRLEGDVFLEISNEDLSGLPDRDRLIYLEILADAALEYPQKLQLI